MILVDTDILIDFLRGYPPSVAWFDSVGYSRITLCGLSALELLEGCRNRNETDALLRFLAPYRIVWPGPRDFDRVLADFAVARLDRKVGIMDVLIGETASGAGPSSPYIQRAPLQCAASTEDSPTIHEERLTEASRAPLLDEDSDAILA